MASVESVPAFLQPGVSVSQPPHLEGDPSLATEILPGPPPLASLHQAAILKKDPKKPSVTYSYLPASDPGTTYTTHFALGLVSAAPSTMDGTRRKRARLDKGCVCVLCLASTRADLKFHGTDHIGIRTYRDTGRSHALAVAHAHSVESSRSQRASARSLAVVAPPADPIVLPEATASSSHVLSDFDPALLPLDSDDAMVSRATSFHPEDSPPEAAESLKRHRPRPTKDKGKGRERERDTTVKVKEEPGVVSLSGDIAPSLVSSSSLCTSPESVTPRAGQRRPLLCLSVIRRAGLL